MAKKLAPHIGQDVIKRAKAKVGTKNKFGEKVGELRVGGCQQETRDLFGTGAVGDYDGDKASDAEDAWKKAAANGKVVKTSDPNEIPAGAYVMFTGGGSDHGHACVGAGGGKVYTTDLPKTGYYGKYSISKIETKWAVKLVGYLVETGDGWTVWDPPAPKPKAPNPKPAVVKSDLWFKLMFHNLANYNDHGKETWETRRARLTALVKTVTPDVYCAVETGSDDVLDYIDARLRAQGLKRIPNGTDGRHIWAREGTEVVASGNFDLQPRFENDDKQAAWTVVVLDGSKALVVSAQLENEGPELIRVGQFGDLERQTAQIAAKYDLGGSRIFLAVDTNSPKGSVTQEAQSRGYVDAFIAAKTKLNETTASWNNWKPPTDGPRIDFLYLTPDRPVLAARQRIRDSSSDHFAQVFRIGRKQ